MAVKELPEAESGSAEDESPEKAEETDQNVDAVTGDARTQIADNLIRAGDRWFLSDAADHFVNQAHRKKYDVWLFLDKGARPYVHLLKARWQARFPGEPVPAIRFTNIGREKSSFYTKSAHHYADLDTVRSRGYVAQLKKHFDFSGQNVLIVDDFTWSGRTVVYAQKLLAHAFPDASIDMAAIATPDDGEKSGLHVKPSSYYGPANTGPGLLLPPLLDRPQEVSIVPLLAYLQQYKKNLEKRIATFEKTPLWGFANRLRKWWDYNRNYTADEEFFQLLPEGRQFTNWETPKEVRLRADMYRAYRCLRESELWRERNIRSFQEGRKEFLSEYVKNLRWNLERVNKWIEESSVDLERYGQARRELREIGETLPEQQE